MVALQVCDKNMFAVDGEKPGVCASMNTLEMKGVWVLGIWQIVG